MRKQAHVILAAALVVASSAPWQAANAAQYTDSFFNYSFTYPDGWHTDTREERPGTVVVRNFPDDQILRLGNVPFGGAEVRVATFPPYPPGLSAATDEYAELHALAARTGTIISETTRASGAPARVKWTGPTVVGSATMIRTVLRIRGRMFWVGVEYQATDPAGPQYEQVLADVLASLLASVGAATPSPLPTP
jgi:hypothetical protein